MGQCGSSEQAPQAPKANTQAKQTSARNQTRETTDRKQPSPAAAAPKANNKPAEESKPAEVAKPAEPVKPAAAEQKDEAVATGHTEKSVDVAVEPPQTDEPSLPAERESNKANDADDAKAEDPAQDEQATAPETTPTADAPVDLEPAAAEDGAADAPAIKKRPSVKRAGPQAVHTITVTERPLGFGAMNGPGGIGAQLTSIKNKELWQNPDIPENYVKSGQYIATMKSPSTGDKEEDVKLLKWRELKTKLRDYEVPLVLTFWEGPEVSAAFENAFESADINEDGHITWDEFQKFSENFADEMECDEAFLHEEFDRYAKDEDGNDMDYLEIAAFKMAVSHVKNDWASHSANPNKSE